MTLDELEAALASATGPSRELDAQFWCAIEGYQFVEFVPGANDRLRVIPVGLTEPCDFFGLEWPEYTASTDAWMSAASGRLVEMQRWFNGEGHVRIYLGSHRYRYAHAPTLDLAGCLAIVRALKAERG